MKIAWFTPFNVESAIGRYSKFAAEAISKYADIDICTFSKGTLHKTFCNVMHLNMDTVYTKLNDYDITVYNIGDCAAYHSEIYEVSQHHIGVIIDHDICLFNLMYGYYIEYKKDIEGFKTLLTNKYGQYRANELFEATLDPKKFSLLDLKTYSLSEHIGEHALGVIVHSMYHKKYIEQFYNGDLDVIAHLDTNDNLTTLDPDIQFDGYCKGRIHILTVGNVNENKHIHSMVQVLGENKDLAAKFDYTVVGSKANTFYCQKLEKMISSYRLESQVRLLGFVSHKELAYYYQQADLICNLRFPAYEGASGSIVEQMSIGKACIVSNTGVYSELDDNAVFKVDPLNELPEIKNILKEILHDQNKIQKVGNNAKKFAKTYFDRDVYARKVYSFLKTIIFHKPLCELADKCAQLLCDMPSIEKISVIEKIAAELDVLYQ